MDKYVVKHSPEAATVTNVQ